MVAAGLPATRRQNIDAPRLTGSMRERKAAEHLAVSPSALATLPQKGKPWWASAQALLGSASMAAETGPAGCGRRVHCRARPPLARPFCNASFSRRWPLPAAVQHTRLPVWSKSARRPETSAGCLCPRVANGYLQRSFGATPASVLYHAAEDKTETGSSGTSRDLAGTSTRHADWQVMSLAGDLRLRSWSASFTTTRYRFDALTSGAAGDGGPRTPMADSDDGHQIGGGSLEGLPRSDARRAQSAAGRAALRGVTPARQPRACLEPEPRLSQRASCSTPITRA